MYYFVWFGTQGYNISVIFKVDRNCKIALTKNLYRIREEDKYCKKHAAQKF